jgi:PAS domain S-box-containing protein
VEFPKTLFSANHFMPHGYCYLWNHRLIWTHVVSDSLIALAYLSIPITLVYSIRKRRDMPLNWMFFCFGVFILACGATHVVEVWNLWHADYWLAGAVKVVTAVASVATAILLVPLVPRALALRSPEVLRREIVERKRAQNALDQANSELERRVQQRTAKLTKVNDALQAEISQHRKTEDALRQSEEQFRSIVDRVRDYAIFCLDQAGIITTWNAGAEHVKGYLANEIVGQHFSRFYVEEDVARGIPEMDMERAAATGRAQSEGWRVRKDGSRFWAHTVLTAIRNDQGDLIGFSKITHDLTERKNAEQKLQEARASLAHMARVTTMGELTSSIAHEINQPLAVIVNNASACRRMLFSESPDLDEVRAAIVDIGDAGIRAGEIITRVRALVKKALPGKARVNINEVIGEVVSLIGGELQRQHVAVRAELSPDLSHVWGDRVQLQQVVLNLVMNGVEAMNIVTDRPRILLIRSDIRKSGHVSVAVQDCGAGLDPGHLPHIFDTFFTTKPAGMGMGLPISRSIIEAHEGRLSARPNETFGATFEFTLPKCA